MTDLCWQLSVVRASVSDGSAAMLWTVEGGVYAVCELDCSHHRQSLCVFQCQCHYQSINQSINTFITRHGTEARATVRIMPKQREMS